MKRNVTIAVARLQGRIRRAVNARKDDLLSEALDLLFSQPYRDGEPNKLIVRAIDAARRRRRRREQALLKNMAKLDWLDGSPLAPAPETRQAVGAAVRKRGPADGRVMRMAVIGASSREMAMALGVKSGAARTRLWRARKMARAGNA